jgi:hypothetical protein
MKGFNKGSFVICNGEYFKCNGFENLKKTVTQYRYVGLVVKFRPKTRKSIRDGWSYYTDTSEPVDDYGVNNNGHCKILDSNPNIPKS